MPIFRATVDLSFPIGSGGGTNSWAIRTVDAGPLELENIQDLMGRVQAFYQGITQLFPSTFSASWDGTVRELGTTEPEFRAPDTGWTVVGSASETEYGPAPAMACVTWRTSLGNRSGRGRTFLGPLRKSAFEGNGTLFNTDLSALRSAAATLADGNGTFEAGALVVWSEVDGVGRDIIGSSVTDQAAVLTSRRS